VPDDLNLHVRDGTTARLDNLQAAFLALKLPTLDATNAERRRLASIYREALSGLPLGLPPEDPPDGDQVFHLFAVEVDDRDAVRAALRDAGIGTGVHYPLPVHLQPVWRVRGHRPGELPVSERLAERILSLPLFPGLAAGEVDRVAAALGDALPDAHRCRRAATRVQAPSPDVG
jgi:dTDP-4-amino-4,6-dideoxygalactose transaminase